MGDGRDTCMAHHHARRGILMDGTTVLAVWAGLCLIPAYVAAQKDRNAVGFFLLGIVISPLLALIVVAVLPSKAAPQRAAVPTIGVADELTKLGALRETGVITADEYDRQRAILLPPVGPMVQVPPGYQCGRCHKPLSPVWKARCEHCKATYAMYRPVPRAP